ncbi:MAG: hypothetical protein K6G72_12170 [Lachnospiraceae bacterium]|nr:hypothetical protein [Lachnospiraceae bacterium]
MKGAFMNIPEIRTATGEIYVRDPRFENRLDTVVQHMLASGFTIEEIMQMLKVDREFIVSLERR